MRHLEFIKSPSKERLALDMTTKGSELQDGVSNKKRSSLPGKGDSPRKLKQLASKHSVDVKGNLKKSNDGLLVPLKKQKTIGQDTKQEALNSTLKQIK